MATFAFSGGLSSVVGWGDRWKFVFAGTWAFGDLWSLDGSFQGSSFTVGAGDVTSNGVPTTCFTYKERVYLSLPSQFNFSDNLDPTAWEQQDPGAGFVPFLTQLGGQDTVNALGQVQGKLAVFGRRTTQTWNVDADPTNFSIQQSLDNVGTKWPLSVQNVGDYDCFFLDDTGFRSLRTLEVNLNNYIDDVGSPIDALVQASLVGASNSASIVDPLTRNYWCSIGQTIYVFTKKPTAGVTAWSTFEARGDDNVLFTPEKFVVYNSIVYCRATNGNFYTYGGAAGATYDVNSQVSFQTSYVDDRKPDLFKQWQSVSYAIQGKWQIQIGVDPIGGGFSTAVTPGSAATPNPLSDSSFDSGTIAYQAHSTHIAVKAVSQNTSTTVPAKFTLIAFNYNKSYLP